MKSEVRAFAGVKERQPFGIPSRGPVDTFRLQSGHRDKTRPVSVCPFVSPVSRPSGAGVCPRERFYHTIQPTVWKGTPVEL